MAILPVQDRKKNVYEKDKKATRVTSLDGESNIINPATSDNQTNGDQVAQARQKLYNEDSQVWNNRVEDDKAVHYCALDVSADTCIVMIDKNDIINFPHNNTNRIDIGAYQVTINGDVNWEGYIGIGFINSIDGTSANVTITNCWQFDKKSGRSIDQGLQRVVPMKGSSEFTISPNFVSTELNTGSTNNTPAGTTTPEAGDWVLCINRTAGTVSVGLTFKYLSV